MARARGRLILGVNCAYHESAAALVRDGEVSFAIEEERLTRTKHAKTAQVTNPDELPWNAIRACLAAGPGAVLSDLDAIAYSLAPGRRLALIGGDPYEIDDEMGFGTRRGEEEFNRRVLAIPHILARCRRRRIPGRTISTSCPIIAPTPRALSMRLRSGTRPFWSSMGSAKPRPPGSAEAHQKVSKRSKKLHIPTRSECSGSGWPFISASRNSMPARSWAWPLMETRSTSRQNTIGSSG